MNILLKNCEVEGYEQNVDIYVQGNRIKEIAPDLDCCELQLNCHGKTTVSGILNTHAHLGETIFRDKFEGKNLQEYLEFTEMVNTRINHEKIRKDISHYTAALMVKEGVSGYCCSRGWDIPNLGVRRWLGYPLMKSKKLSMYYENREELFDRIYKTYSTQLDSIGLWVHSLDFVDDEGLEFASTMKKRNKCFFTMHFSEERPENIEILESYSLLGEKSVLVHCNHLTKQAVEIISDTATNVTICPDSNLFLKTGIPDMDALLKSNMNVTIGTDGFATGGNPNLVDCFKTCKSLWPWITNKTLISMITKNAYLALGIEENIFQKGSLADITILDEKGVFHALVNGKPLTIEREWTGKSFDKLESKFNRIQTRVFK